MYVYFIKREYERAVSSSRFFDNKKIFDTVERVTEKNATIIRNVSVLRIIERRFDFQSEFFDFSCATITRHN